MDAYLDTGQDDKPSRNVVRPCGYTESECGYCKGKRCSVIPLSPLLLIASSPSIVQQTEAAVAVAKTPQTCSRAYGLLVDRMEPDVYEQFLYRGWRRSGTHLYKPCNWESCCPTITIRLPVVSFQASRSQRKLLKRMEALLAWHLRDPSLPISCNPTQKLKQQPQQKQGKKGKKQSLSASELMLKEAGVFDRLNYVSIELLRELCPFVSSEDIQPKFKTRLNASSTTNVSRTTPKANTTSFKSPQPPQHDSPFQKAQPKASPASTSDGSSKVITLITSICASIAGKYRNYKVDRGMLAEQLSKVLDVRLSSSPANTPFSNAIQYASTSHHSLSGQIFVNLHLNANETSTAIVSDSNGGNMHAPSESTRKVHRGDSNDYNIKSNHDAMDDTSSMDMMEIVATANVDKTQDADANNDKQSHSQDQHPISKANDNGERDRLAVWYEQHTNGLMLSADQRQEVVINTLPAHESVLDPQVHRLYALYQHIVHNDADPFADVKDDKVKNGEVATPKTNDPNRSKHAPDAAHAPNISVEKLAGEQPAISNTSDISPEMASKVDKLDWGPTASTQFVPQIRSVVKSYLKQFPETKHAAIMENFHSFYQFLVESPIIRQTSASSQTNVHERAAPRAQSTPSQVPCGTYHQHYRIGEVLIAVGVVDVLPRGLSSVYLFYHPSFAHELVALGKWTTLKEIEYTRTVLKAPYYYLGYYIESCPKMKYKADYGPSEMLCPVHYEWVSAKEGKSKLEKAAPHHMCAFVDGPATADGENGGKRSRIGTTDDGDGNLQNHSNVATAIGGGGGGGGELQNPPLDLSNIEMDVGAGIPVTIGMLQAEGQNIVRPHLEGFAREAGPEIQTQCQIKLN